jgi:hypothetical protein
MVIKTVPNYSLIEQLKRERQWPFPSKSFEVKPNDLYYAYKKDTCTQWMKDIEDGLF